MFKLNTTKGIVESIRQIMTPIKYEVRVPSSDWSTYFGKYENQKWGQWDSDSCWYLSAINCAEDQLEYLYKTGQFSDEAKKFFNDNGYIDTDGDFSLSERFGEIISGVKDNGNDQMDAWILMQEYGCIPRFLLTYMNEEAYRFTSQQAFDNDYFNKNVISSQMYALGQEFLKHVNISRQWIGKAGQTPSLDVLKAALKQAPLQIGIPVPYNTINWNQPIVEYDGGLQAQHAVELYAIDDKGQYLIFDQYLPSLKILSSDYLLIFVTQGIINPVQTVIVNPVPQDIPTNSMWQAVMNWFNGIFNPRAGSVST